MVNGVIELNSDELASCSDDNTIKIYNILGNEYKVTQTLNEHKDYVIEIIELKNKKLVSCSFDKKIIFYDKSKNEYQKEYSFTTNGKNGPIIQTKENEICFCDSESKERNIYFFDINKKIIINKINSINISNYASDCLLMISKDLLLITGYNTMSIINVYSYNLIRKVDESGSEHIRNACLLNKNMILTEDENKRIIQCEIEDDNLKLISKKENAHKDEIYTLSKIGSNLFLSGSQDKLVKIW